MVLVALLPCEENKYINKDVGKLKIGRWMVQIF